MINAISPFQPQSIQASQPLNSQSIQNTQQTNFSQLLKQSIEEVNSMQIKSDEMTSALAAGKNVELQDVMIAAEKASVTLLTTIEIRNKAVEAYQEMMRMQI
ncbi:MULTISPECIES: flagellar hook-basal body complex protein FliE [Bacillaceae]|uniref:flagellar hook-basal body complex protein FliE n=1 Tax=Bacillaceae TaxID=186817 RepID=UPI000C769FE8|nr:MULTISPECIES: flagellar hook-basal body complex protein FliE [Bacillaceae]PLR69747.1 flagellar hook-basal body complex protein FliE [Bacillus sp. UMB0893]